MSTPNASRNPTGSVCLDDFLPLLPAESTLLRAAMRGDIAKVGYLKPRADSVDTHIRGNFLAFLARGGDARAPVADRRLQVMGARIVGDLQLSGERIPLSLWLFRCALGGPVVLNGAQVLGSLTFSDCVMLALRAENCRIEGDLELGAGCRIARDLLLSGSRIGGSLDAERLKTARGLVADGIQVEGDVVLRGHAQTVGEVRFVAARIGGSFRASGARLTGDLDENGARGVALNLDRVRLGGDLSLDDGFSAAGAVRLAHAHVHGDFDATGAEFDVTGDANWGANGGALRLDHARIDGALILRKLEAPLQGASLLDARVGTLSDDAGAWGRDHVIDGFAYERFGPGAPTDAPTRLAWLARQQSSHLDVDFRPDPWRRLLRALRRAGHQGSAAGVAIGRERHLRRIGRIGTGSPVPLRWLTQLIHGAWGLVSGYGQRPWRLLAVAVVVWLACGGIYWAAAAPVGDGWRPYANSCRDGCVELPAAQAFGYSFRALVPLESANGAGAALGARPMPPALDVGDAAAALRCLAWFESACGWALALAALVDLFGLVDRDRYLR